MAGYYGKGPNIASGCGWRLCTDFRPDWPDTARKVGLMGARAFSQRKDEAIRGAVICAIALDALDNTHGGPIARTR